MDVIIYAAYDETGLQSINKLWQPMRLNTVTVTTVIDRSLVASLLVTYIHKLFPGHISLHIVHKQLQRLVLKLLSAVSTVW